MDSVLEIPSPRRLDSFPEMCAALGIPEPGESEIPFTRGDYVISDELGHKT